MFSNLGANYSLNNDIDCSGVANFKPVGYCVGSSCTNGDDFPFQGNFHGNYSTISNLNITNLTTSDNGWGLFGYINNSNISNVNLNSLFVNVNQSYVGGLIGYSSFSSVSNSSSSGTVTGTGRVGGLVGESTGYSSVSNSYSSGDVSGTTVVGGLIGNYSSGSITDIFWDNISTSVNQTFGSGSNINVTAIQDNISYFYGNSSLPMLNWDTNVWDFYDTKQPHLAYENYVVASMPTPSSSAVSSTSLPSFGAVVLALVLLCWLWCCCAGFGQYCFVFILIKIFY